jgi:lipopolysaccharide biosynthesis protein
LIDQYEYNTRKGPFYEELSSLPPEEVVEYPVRYLTYYLPQFHQTEVNDAAWGAGFTEWTNTSKALPRYVGHYQPRLPADLGFYNLEDVRVLERQVELAKRGGIFGFCIHYYWFSGKKILDKPLSILLGNAKIDLPFCINWANENWTRRWDGSEQTILLRQEYKKQDPLLFAQAMAEIIQDRRYIRVNGRPLIMLYRPGVVPDILRVVETWRNYLVKAGLGNPYIVMPQAFGADDPHTFGLDAAPGFPPHKFGFTLPSDRWSIKLLDPDFAGITVSYEKMIEQAVAYRPTSFGYFPAVSPSWDNEARKPKSGFSVYGSTPRKYGDWLRAASDQALGAPSLDERIVFINAWNEWAEGAYLEPDRHHGFAYLAETRRVLEAVGKTKAVVPCRNSSSVEERFVTKPLFRNRIPNLYFALGRHLNAR